MNEEMNGKSRTVAVNNPGGQPRQFLVQFREERSGIWRRSAVFRNLDNAEQCVCELKRQGLETRLVSFRLPTAA